MTFWLPLSWHKLQNFDFMHVISEFFLHQFHSRNWCFNLKFFFFSQNGNLKTISPCGLNSVSRQKKKSQTSETESNPLCCCVTPVFTEWSEPRLIWSQQVDLTTLKSPNELLSEGKKQQTKRKMVSDWQVLQGKAPLVCKRRWKFLHIINVWRRGSWERLVKSEANANAHCFPAIGKFIPPAVWGQRTCGHEGEMHL